MTEIKIMRRFLKRANAEKLAETLKEQGFKKVRVVKSQIYSVQYEKHR